MGEDRDELLDSLQGLDSVEESSQDSELHQLRVRQPSAWKREFILSDFEFDKSILTAKGTVTVNGQFSTDLDLFYSEDDVKSLFDYESQDYKEVCD